MDDWTDEQLGAMVRRCARVVRAGALSSGESVRVDGQWFVVAVDRSAWQQEGGHARGASARGQGFEQHPLIAAVLQEYGRHQPAEWLEWRGARWVMSQATHDLIRELCGVDPPDDDDELSTEPSHLMGLPIEINDEAEGVSIVDGRR